MGGLGSSLVRLLVPRHDVVFVPNGGAADNYGASNGHDPLAAVSGRSTVDSTSASTTRSSTSGGANGVRQRAPGPFQRGGARAVQVTWSAARPPRGAALRGEPRPEVRPKRRCS